ncbi:unnamed protein product [Schistosoma mattheei]|uniref:DUF5746 domain-containing protein n=1 Tax=Schistosoma mattheei TaxID=31246 RepID=A0AA85AQZ1_9TREM|nr:unnamed protein product [Schistosoma mattheei]
MKHLIIVAKEDNNTNIIHSELIDQRQIEHVGNSLNFLDPHGKQCSNKNVNKNSQYEDEVIKTGVYSIRCWLVVISFITIAYVTKTNYLEYSNKPIVKQTQHCFVCDNYASLSDSSGFRPGPGTGLAWFGGKPVVGGWTSMSSNGNH